MEKIESELFDKINKQTKSVLKIDPTATPTVGHSGVLEYFGNYNVRAFVFITKSGSIADLETYLQTHSSQGSDGLLKLGLVIGTDAFSKEIVGDIHSKKLGFIQISDPTNDAGVNLVVRYLEFLSRPTPTLDKIISEFEEVSSETGEHYEHKCSTLLFNYVNFNGVRQFLAKDDGEKLLWEATLITAVIRNEKSIRGNSTSEDVPLFNPLYSYETEGGKTVSHPDLQQIDNDSVKAYFLQRLETSQIPYLRRRYLEFLIYFRYPKLIKPDCFKDLILALQQCISWTESKSGKFNFPEMKITELLQRVVEVLDRYFSAFDDGFKESVYNYYFEKVEHFRVQKHYRWTLDLARFVLLYKNLHTFLKSKISYFISLAEDGLKASISQSNLSITESYINLVSDLKIFDNQLDFDRNLELAALYEKEAKTRANLGSKQVGCHFLELSIACLQKAKSDQKDKIRELKKLYEQYAKDALSELKKIEIKMDMSPILQERERYLAHLEKISTPVERIGAYFSDSNLLIDESFFLDLCKKANQGLSGMIPPTIVGERGTVAKPTSPEEEQEIREFSLYGNCSIVYLEKIFFILDGSLKKQFFCESDFRTYVEKLDIQPELKEFYYEAFSLFFEGHYLASVSVILPVIERLFRLLQKRSNEDVKFKKSGVEYNVSLDAMIANSVESGMPLNVIRFSRYLLTQAAGVNLRNEIFHGFSEFKTVNQRYYAILVIWLGVYLASVIRYGTPSEK